MGPRKVLPGQRQATIKGKNNTRFSFGSLNAGCVKRVKLNPGWSDLVVIGLELCFFFSEVDLAGNAYRKEVHAEEG